MNKSLVYVFGRMNPPTRAHFSLIDFGLEIAQSQSSDFRLVLSRSHDSNNPLTFDEKCHLISLLKRVNIESEPLLNPYQALEFYAKKYVNITFIVGSDRLQGFQSMERYATDFGVRNFQLMLFGDARNESESFEIPAISASRARAYAREGDLDLFKTQIPDMESHTAEKLFETIRKRL